MTENCIDLTCLHFVSLIFTGAKCGLHDFRETHSLVDTRYSKCKILHHPTHSSALISCSSAPDVWKKAEARTRLDHLLQAPVGVNLHRKQVVETVDFRCILTELLRESIGEVMSWICGLCRQL